MPFTLCHPALVIPLNRCFGRSTSLAALVIGSMAPDLVYFFPIAGSGSFTHSLPGLLIYCIPSGIIIYTLYFALLREAFIACAPRAIALRMRPRVAWIPTTLPAAAIVLASLLIGAASHVFWDGFTHPNTYFVNRFDVLHLPVSIGDHVFPFFKILQHLSSVVGFLVIAGDVAYWYLVTPPHRQEVASLSNRQRLCVALTIVAATTAGGVFGFYVRVAKSPGQGLFNLIVTAMAAAALTIVLLSLVRRIKAAST